MPNFLFFETDVFVVAIGPDVRASVPKLNVTDMRSRRRTPESVTDLHVPSNFMQERAAGIGVLFHRGELPSYKHLGISFDSYVIDWLQSVPDGTGHVLIFHIVTDIDIDARG